MATKPYGFRGSAEAVAAMQATEQLTQLTYNFLAISTMDILEASSVYAVTGSRFLIKYFKDSYLAGAEKRMARVNDVVGQRVRDAVVKRFNEQLQAAHGGAYGRTTGPYRIGQGRIGGNALAAALADPSAVGVPLRDGLLIANPAALFAKAEFWRRLNYGTGSQDGKGSKKRQVSYSFKGTNILQGRVSALSDPSPFPGWMPPGIWMNRGKPVLWSNSGNPSNRFQPFFNTESENLQRFHRAWKKKPTEGTKGNVGWRFLDAGYEAYAQYAPKAYESIFRELAREAKKAGASAESQVFVASNGKNKPYVTSSFI